MNWVNVAVAIVGLVGKLIIMVPGYFYKRQRGVHAFKKQLHLTGMSNDHMETLTSAYKDMGDLKKMIKQYGPEGKH